MDCLFCKIIQGDIPSAKVYEDEVCYAFRDINPQAPVHIVLVPKTHVTDVADAARLDDATLAARKAKWVCPEPRIKTGYLARYAKLVTSAARGAVLE